MFSKKHFLYPKARAWLNVAKKPGYQPMTGGQWSVQVSHIRSGNDRVYHCGFGCSAERLGRFTARGDGLRVECGFHICSKLPFILLNLPVKNSMARAWLNYDLMSDIGSECITIWHVFSGPLYMYDLNHWYLISTLIGYLLWELSC